jgi:hypothetical protein
MVLLEFGALTTHTHTNIPMCKSLPTIAPRSFLHYHMHYTNSATDSVVQQLSKYSHSYFAVLFAECHCTRPAQSGRGTASTIQLLRTKPREGCSRKDTSEASKLAGLLQQLGNGRNMRHSSTLRGGAPHEASRGLPGTYRTVVTIRTTSLTFTNSTFCPHTVFMCFVWISEQTAIISLYSINWLVFITDAVFTARYGLKHYTIQVNFRLLRPCHGSGGKSPTSHRGLPGSIPGQSVWDLWRTNWHSNRGLSQYFCFPLSSVSFHDCSILTFIWTLLLPGQTSETWEHIKKQCSFGNRSNLDIKVLPNFVAFKMLKYVQWNCRPRSDYSA